MSRRTRILATVAAILSLTVASWALFRGSDAPVSVSKDKIENPAPPASSAPIKLASAADIKWLEEEAAKSCLCEREGGTETACWQAYREKTVGMAVAGNAFACAPVSTELDCIATADGEVCITTGYYVTATSDARTNHRLCTEDEARAVETAYRDAWLGPDGVEPNPNIEAEWRTANKKAVEAVDKIVTRITSGGGVVSIYGPDGGCIS